MLKPTKHHAELGRALSLHRLDDYETAMEYIAHVLLDVLVWVGDVELFDAAVRRAGELAVEQHEQALEALLNYEPANAVRLAEEVSDG